MNVAERIQEAEQKFNSLSEKRTEHLKLAEECLSEMSKLQGEYRLLVELQESEKSENKTEKVKTNA